MDDQTIERLIRGHVAHLDVLRRLPPDFVITCTICDGKAPEPHLCGCGGTQTVVEAIRHHEFEIEILEK